MRQLFFILVALAPACTDDVDLTGVYQVDSHVGSASCGADVTINGYPYMSFSKQSFFGQDYFAYSGCTDAAATDCQEIGGLVGGFQQPVAGGWKGFISLAFTSNSDCTLGYDDASAMLTGDQLVVETHHYLGQVQLAADQCTTKEAEARADTLPCTGHELINATLAP